MYFYLQITNYKGNYARDSSISIIFIDAVVVAVRSRKSVTVVSQGRLFSNRPANLRINCPTIRPDLHVFNRVWCTVVRRFSNRVKLLSSSLLVIVAECCTYVRTYVLEAARYASDNGVASRQRKSSHEKCTPPSTSKPSR